MSGPDWPILDYAIAWASGPADDPGTDLWYSLTSRTEGTTTVSRGKEYELDQVQPGEMDFTLRNDDGAFDPTNTASPFWPNVVAYRLCRLRAQYPPTPANQLLPDQATAFHASLGAVTTSTLPQWITLGTVGIPLSIAPLDGTSNQYVLPAAWASYSDPFTVGGFSISLGTTYTAQAQFSCGVSVQLLLRIDWIDRFGFVAGVTDGAVVTGTSGLITVTGTPPAGTVAARIHPRVITGTVASALNIFKLGIEAAATPSAWTTPGTWYPMFTGYIERWPQGWDAAGSYGTVDLTAVDRFTWLANRPLNAAFFNEVLALSPWRLYPLNEDSGATSFADYLGLRADAIIYTPRSGVYQTLTPGSAVQSAAPALPPAGINGPVVTFTNQASQTVSQLIDLTGGGKNTGFGVNGQWTRVFAFRTPKTAALAGNQASLMRAYQKNPYADSYVSVGGSYDGSGNYTNLQAVVVANGSTVASSTVSSANLSDGSWHLLVVAVDTSANTLSLWLDGQPVTVSNTGSFPTTPTGTDVLGGRLTIATKSTPGPAGDYAMCADWTRILSNTEVANLWEAFQYGWGSQSLNRDESSSVRYQRLLNWAAATGTPRIDAGATVQYGPATDLTSDSKLLDALQNVVDTEAGQHYLGADGQIVFKSRRARINPVPTVTFGENPGEIAYLSASTDFDPTLVVNDATATAQYGLGAEATSYRVTDTTSGNTYGDLSTNLTVNTLDNGELLGAAQYQLYEGKQPLLRLEALPVDVGNNPTYWPTLLGLDLGTPVTWNRRPPNAPALSMVGFVEQISWSIDDQRHAAWTGQLSNAALHQFGVLDDTTYGKFNSTLIFGY